MKIGAAGFIVPFMFVYEPALLMIGDWPTIIQAVLTASIGCLLLSAGLHGYFIGPSNRLQSALLIAACFFLVNPALLSSFADKGSSLAKAGSIATDLIGLGFCGDRDRLAAGAAKGHRSDRRLRRAAIPKDGLRPALPRPRGRRRRGLPARRGTGPSARQRS